VTLSPDGFFKEAHAKLRPVEFAADGVYLCGTAPRSQALKREHQIKRWPRKEKLALITGDTHNLKQLSKFQT